MPSDPTKKPYERLLADGLIGMSVARYKDRKLEEEFERHFQHWQNETVFPAAVNRWVKEIGDET